MKVSIAGVFRCCVDNAFKEAEKKNPPKRITCPHCKADMKVVNSCYVNCLDEE